MSKKVTGLAVAFQRTHAARPHEPRPRVLLTPNAVGTERSSIRILVGDRDGYLRGELTAEVAGIAWKLNEYAQARLTMSQKDATAQERLLRPGNRVLIQFSNGLPDWGGVIDTPRRWRDGLIDVTAYSAEYVLTWRVTGRGRYFRQVTAGEIFRSLIQEAAPLGLTVGQVWFGGEAHSPSYHYRELYDIVTDSLTQRIERADWDVRARLVNGQILFVANYYERKGIDYGRRVALLEGVNAVRATLDEQGQIANEVFLAGNGTGWGETNRLYSTASDTNSQGRYGLRQVAETRIDVSVQTTLDTNAALMLSEQRVPRPVVSIDAMDLAPGRFRQYDIGDTVWMELYERGFDGYAAPVRIVAREFLPTSNLCALVIE